MAQSSGFDPTLKVKTCFDCKVFAVANWVARLNGEDGLLHLRPFQFHFKEHWKYQNKIAIELDNIHHTIV